MPNKELKEETYNTQIQKQNTETEKIFTTKKIDS